VLSLDKGPKRGLNRSRATCTPSSAAPAQAAAGARPTTPTRSRVSSRRRKRLGWIRFFRPAHVTEEGPAVAGLSTGGEARQEEDAPESEERRAVRCGLRTRAWAVRGLPGSVHRVRPAGMDHWLNGNGRKQQKESILTCWLLHFSCHKARHAALALGGALEQGPREVLASEPAFHSSRTSSTNRSTERRQDEGVQDLVGPQPHGHHASLGAVAGHRGPAVHRRLAARPIDGPEVGRTSSC